MMNEAVAVFRRQYVIDTGVAELTSSPIDARGNEVILSVLATNLVVTNDGTLEVTLEGSYDGQAWEDLSATVSLDEFGHGSASKSGLDHAYVRVRGVASPGTSGSAQALFDATLAFSEQ